MSKEKTYISFKDHSAVVKECRRLLYELKCKYEESRSELTAQIHQLEEQLDRVRRERDVWRMQHKTLEVRMSWNEKRTIRLESERKKALDCLQELLSYAERLEQKKRNSKKRRSIADVRRKLSAGRRRNKFQSNKVEIGGKRLKRRNNKPSTRILRSSMQQSGRIRTGNNQLINGDYDEED